MTRPTVRIGGQDQTGRISPKEPTFADALAYWKCDDSPFADSAANGLDFAVWDSALSAARIESEYKSAFGR